MPTVTKTIVENYTLRNDYGKAWGYFDFWIDGEFTKVELYIRVHAYPRNVFGAPSDCLVTVYFNSEKTQQVYGSGYFVEIGVWEHVQYCTKREARKDVTTYIGGRNTVIVTFDVASWGLGSMGVVEVLQAIITYPEGSPEPTLEIQKKEEKSYEGAIKLLNEFMYKVFMPMMMIMMMMSLIRGIREKPRK